MKLTSEQEAQLIERYDSYLWKIIHRFKGRDKKNGFHRGGYQNLEDLHSECVLVFLNHIRSSETIEDFKKLPSFELLQAMCKYVLGEQVVSYPRRTSNFSSVMETVPCKVDDELLKKEATMVCDPFADVLDRIAFEEYFQSLSKEKQDVMTMKLKGFQNREIARKLNVSDSTVSRIMKALQQSYHDYAA